MRPFRFRIYDKVRKEWVHKGINLFGEIMLFGMHTVRQDGTPVKVQELNDLEAMQFTGLKDKDGIEIYEGDIIRSESHNPELMVIDFIEGGFAAVWDWFENKSYPIDINHFYPSTGCMIKVVGNIFDNPDLLEKK